MTQTTTSIFHHRSTKEKIEQLLDENLFLHLKVGELSERLQRSEQHRRRMEGEMEQLSTQVFQEAYRKVEDVRMELMQREQECQVERDNGLRLEERIVNLERILADVIHERDDLKETLADLQPRMSVDTAARMEEPLFVEQEALESSALDSRKLPSSILQLTDVTDGSSNLHHSLDNPDGYRASLCDTINTSMRSFAFEQARRTICSTISGNQADLEEPRLDAILHRQSALETNSYHDFVTFLVSVSPLETLFLRKVRANDLEPCLQSATCDRTLDPRILTRFSRALTEMTLVIEQVKTPPYPPANRLLSLFTAKARHSVVPNHLSCGLCGSQKELQQQTHYYRFRISEQDPIWKFLCLECHPRVVSCAEYCHFLHMCKLGVVRWQGDEMNVYMRCIAYQARIFEARVL